MILLRKEKKIADVVRDLLDKRFPDIDNLPHESDYNRVADFIFN